MFENKLIKSNFFIKIIIVLFFLIICSCSNESNKKESKQKIKNNNEIPDYLKKVNDADGSLGRIRASGKLKLGVDPNVGLPFVTYYTGKEFTGFDINLANYIAQKLGCDLEIVKVNWENLIKGLEKDKYDIILNAFEKPINNKKTIEKIGFSKAYYNNSLVIVINKNSKAINLNDLKNQKVGVILNSTAEEFIKEMNKVNKAQIKLITYNNTHKLFTDLKNNSLNALFIDKPIATWNCSQAENNCQFIDKNTLKSEYVISVNRKNRALLNSIDEILRKAKSDEKYIKIFKTWSLY